MISSTSRAASPASTIHQTGNVDSATKLRFWPQASRRTDSCRSQSLGTTPSARRRFSFSNRYQLARTAHQARGKPADELIACPRQNDIRQAELPLLDTALTCAAGSAWPSAIFSQWLPDGLRDAARSTSPAAGVMALRLLTASGRRSALPPLGQKTEPAVGTLRIGSGARVDAGVVLRGAVVGS